jgi:hypothetical protein
MFPEAEKSRVRAVRLEAVTSHWMLAQKLMMDSQPLGSSASLDRISTL